MMWEKAVTVIRAVDDINATVAFWTTLGNDIECIATRLGCPADRDTVRACMLQMLLAHDFTSRSSLALYELDDMVKARKAKGYSQTRMAAEIGVSRSIFKNYERGERRPTPATLAAWRQALGLAETKRAA